MVYEPLQKPCGPIILQETRRDISSHLKGRTEKRKTYTTTTERKSFGELFWPKRKIFHVGGGYTIPTNTRETNECTKPSHSQSPANFVANLNGAGVLHKFGADFFCLFFLASIFQKTECSNRFFVQIFGAQIFAQIFAPIFAQIFGVQIFCADFFSDFWCADFCADFRADFPQIFLRRFGALKIGVPESRKNAQKICGKICGVPMALPGGVPHSISAFSSRQHVTQSPPGPRTQGEHVSAHRGIFGPKGMLGFAPRFFKNKNLRKIRSGKH